MTSHTGPSRRGRSPGVRQYRARQIEIGGSVHYLKYIDQVAHMTRWRCSCGELIGVVHRSHDDAGEYAALMKHQRALDPSHRTSRRGQTSPASRRIQGGRVSAKRNKSSGVSRSPKQVGGRDSRPKKVQPLIQPVSISIEAGQFVATCPCGWRARGEEMVSLTVESDAHTC